MQVADKTKLLLDKTKLQQKGSFCCRARAESQTPDCCRANEAHIRQSRPDSVFGCQVKVFNTMQLVSASVRDVSAANSELSESARHSVNRPFECSIRKVIPSPQCESLNTRVSASADRSKAHVVADTLNTLHTKTGPHRWGSTQSLPLFHTQTRSKAHLVADTLNTLHTHAEPHRWRAQIGF